MSAVYGKLDIKYILLTSRLENVQYYFNFYVSGTNESQGSFPNPLFSRKKIVLILTPTYQQCFP